MEQYSLSNLSLYDNVNKIYDKNSILVKRFIN